MFKRVSNRRQYARLNTVFPVEFQYIDDSKNPTSVIFQGFTRNVGKGGMCIEVKAQKGKEDFQFVANETRLSLIINIPSAVLATKSSATVRWSKKTPQYLVNTYQFGVEYDEMDSDNQKMIEHHVQWLQRRSKLLYLFFILLLSLTLLLVYWGLKP
jgi:hypothetical protein